MQLIIPTKQPRKSRHLGLLLDPELHDQIKALAAEANVSHAEVARQLITDALKRHRPNP